MGKAILAQILAWFTEKKIMCVSTVEIEEDFQSYFDILTDAVKGSAPSKGCET